jgi:hypothetical protein
MMIGWAVIVAFAIVIWGLAHRTKSRQGIISDPRGSQKIAPVRTIRMETAL